MKKKVLIVLAIIIAIGIIAGVTIVVPAMNESENEKLIREEVNKLNELAEKEYNAEEVNTILNRTVSSGDYVEAEKAIKAYMKDFFDMTYNVVNQMEMANVDTILDEKNLTEDGPDFNKTKESLNNLKVKLNEYKEKSSEFLTEEKMKSYIEGKNLSDSVKDFYINELAKVEDEDKKGIEELNKAIDKAIVITEKIENVVNYVANNKGAWTVENGLPVFTTQAQADEYNQLLQGIIDSVN